MIYHYTNIEALALILHNQKIRFNRLDQVDDVLESSEYKKLNFSKYLFISCWTENPEENIVLWHMYSKNMKGVRIGLSNPPFKMKLVNSASTKIPFYIEGDQYLPITIDECFNKSFFIVPLFFNDLFYKKVEYLDDSELQQRFENMVTKVINTDNTFTINAHGKDFARIKHERWKFQEESRFVLLIVPPIADPKDVSLAMNQLFNEIPLNITYYDVDLDPLILQEMEITLGPNCSISDKLIVESLLQRYSVRKEVLESKLKGQIRNNK